MQPLPCLLLRLLCKHCIESTTRRACTACGQSVQQGSAVILVVSWQTCSLFLPDPSDCLHPT